MVSKNDYELDVSMCTNISASSGPTYLLYALLTVYRTVAHRWIKVPAGLYKFLHTKKDGNSQVSHIVPCVSKYSSLSFVTND